MTGSCEIKKTHSPGLHTVTTHRGSVDELFVLAYPIPGEDPLALFRRSSNALKERNARILNHFVWHKPEHREAARDVWESILGKTQWPVSWMVDNVATHPYGGTTIRAIAGAPVESLEHAGRPAGALYETEVARYLILGDLHGDSGGSRPEQAQEVFDSMMELLGRAGMDFSNVIRTWFFNHKILSWYGEFNKVRTDFFNKHKVFDGVVPASTGIGAPNLNGDALIASLIAASPKSPGFTFKAIPSPLQHPALDYGSSFSRAVEIETPDRKHVMVSGTASIDMDGNSIHLGDAGRQTHFTLDVVEAILESRGMKWENTVEGIAYIRDEKDTETVLRCLESRGLRELPLLFSRNTVCRDDLLFELELQATNCNVK